MTNTLKWLLIVDTLLLLIMVSISTYDLLRPIDNSIYHKYDSIQHELLKERLRRDTVSKAIAASEERVDTIIKWYNREKATITNQSSDADMLFFADYLSSEAE